MTDAATQGSAAGLLFCAGILTGLLYDLIPAARRAWLRTALDALWLLLAAGLLLAAALLADNGRMRWYFLAADALGAVLSAWAFRPLLHRKHST